MSVGAVKIVLQAGDPNGDEEPFERVLAWVPFDSPDGAFAALGKAADSANRQMGMCGAAVVYDELALTAA